jgi:hypothetical protein
MILGMRLKKAMQAHGVRSKAMRPHGLLITDDGLAHASCHHDLQRNENTRAQQPMSANAHDSLAAAAPLRLLLGCMAVHEMQKAEASANRNRAIGVSTGGRLLRPYTCHHDPWRCNAPISNESSRLCVLGVLGG